ncbi:MAG: 1,4-dihydroxy-6-naphthoate synthase [Bacteroidia bacterium]|nr:MAG: 1,4-dihydroxy-6-naphthoate synthase [Bacteroidia bacterium]
MKLSLAFSSCPNDTFIFDAAIHKKIDTCGIDFEPTIGDVEFLNKKAFTGTSDITKISHHAFVYASANYALLDAGSALGRNNGPLLISKKKIYPDEIPNLKIAIPGFYTTANLLLSIASPEAKDKQEYLFSDIETAVLDNAADAGLIIHESRFTYQEKGLKKILDTGEYWENLTRMPIPLGGIAIHRKHSPELRKKINTIIRKSIEFARQNPRSGENYMRLHAQEMAPTVMQQHIDLYVNTYSSDLGKEGRNAVKKLYEEADKRNLIPAVQQPIFAL